MLIDPAVLYFSAPTQENTAGYWSEKGYLLSTDVSNELAVKAIDKAIHTDPNSDTARVNNDNAPKCIDERYEAVNAYEKALKIVKTQRAEEIRKSFSTRRGGA